MLQYKALPPPYGMGKGISLSLRIEGDLPDAEELKQSVEGFGSPPEFTDKIVACLRHSARYDCRVTDHFHNPRVVQMLVREFTEIGVGVLLDGEAAGDFCGK